MRIMIPFMCGILSYIFIMFGIMQSSETLMLSGVIIACIGAVARPKD